MKEITVKNNELGLGITINGEPDLKEMDEGDFTVLASVLELIVSRQYENYVKRKKSLKADS